MTVKEFFNNSKLLAINCDTEEKANKLLDKFNKLGYKWADGKSYKSNSHYEWFGRATCYFNDRTYGPAAYAANSKDVKCIRFEDLDDFKQEKQNLVNKLTILNDLEFDYLSNVIKPFINDIDNIARVNGFS